MAVRHVSPFETGRSSSNHDGNDTMTKHLFYNESLGVHDYSAYIARLKGVLDAASAEPPAGVDTATVEHRMALLQATLDEVERRNAEIHRSNEAMKQKRYMDNHQRRLEIMMNNEARNQLNEKQRAAQVKEMREQQHHYYSNRNEKMMEKAQRCRDHSEKVHYNTMEKANTNESRRQRNLENLMAVRERQRLDMRHRSNMRQEHARAVNESRDAHLERERTAKQQAAELHEQQMAIKLAEIRDSRRSHWVAKKSASRAKSTVVWANGEAQLETEAKDHDVLLQELDKKMQEQEMRLREGQAARQQYLQQCADQHLRKQERQQQSLLHNIDRRLQRGEEILQELHKKTEKSDAAKVRKAKQFTASAERLQKSIDEHKRRVEELENHRRNATLDKQYKRWNHRAARILAGLHEVIEAEESTAATHEPSGGMSSTWGTSRDEALTHIPDRSRRVPLPSPSSFYVS